MIVSKEAQSMSLAKSDTVPHRKGLTIMALFPTNHSAGTTTTNTSLHNFLLGLSMIFAYRTTIFALSKLDHSQAFYLWDLFKQQDESSLMNRGPSTIYFARYRAPFEIYEIPCYNAAAQSTKHDGPTDLLLRLQPARVRKGNQSVRPKGKGKTPKEEKSLLKVAAKAKKADKDGRYGCPFSKHCPTRYEKVYGRACTQPPGLEAKRIIEHLRRVHSVLRETKCRFCGLAWAKVSDSDEERLEELAEHLQPGQCSASDEVINQQPEYMNADQEEVVNTSERDDNDPSADRHWAILYMRLFPDEPIPCAQYDYFIPRHQTTIVETFRVPARNHSLFGVFPSQRVAAIQNASMIDGSHVQASNAPDDGNDSGLPAQSIRNAMDMEASQIAVSPPADSASSQAQLDQPDNMSFDTSVPYESFNSNYYSFTDLGEDLHQVRNAMFDGAILSAIASEATSNENNPIITSEDFSDQSPEAIFTNGIEYGNELAVGHFQAQDLGSLETESRVPASSSMDEQNFETAPEDQTEHAGDLPVMQAMDLNFLWGWDNTAFSMPNPPFPYPDGGDDLEHQRRDL